MSRWPANKPEDVWRHINIGESDECWNHTMKGGKQGYGYMKISQASYMLHRIVFWLSNPGVIELRAPKDKSKKEFVLHECDNPRCCNPRHLFVGSHLDNMRDMVDKGRNVNPGGEDHPSSKLTREDADKIRELAKSGIKLAEIGRKYGVTRYCIWDVVHRRTYRA